MEKVSLPIVYDLATALRRVSEMNVSADTNRMLFIRDIVSLKVNLKKLLDAFAALSTCRQAGHDLNGAIDEWIDSSLAEENLRQPLESKDEVGARVIINKAKTFETVLSEEMQTLAVYQVTRKGAYSTPILVDNAENALPESVRHKVSEEVVHEIRQSGRCLAFDNSTASGFHMMRATESVLHQYYLEVCHPDNDATLDSWGDYLSALRKRSDDVDVQEVVALLQQIKDLRNRIMHPEIVLEPDDAFRVFEESKAAIIVMAQRLP